MSKTALEMALDDLKVAKIMALLGGVPDECTIESFSRSIIALEKAIKQQGEPVGYVNKDALECLINKQADMADLVDWHDGAYDIPLYTSAPTIPEDWQLVPKKPTPEMCWKMHLIDFDDVSAEEKYQAFLENAPEYKGKDGYAIFL